MNFNERNTSSLEHYPEILTPKMIAQYLGIGYVKSLNLLKTGTIPCIRLGNAYKVSKEAFSAWLNQPGLREIL